MIDPKHLDHFVARFMANLPDSLAARKEDLVTLLVLLPKTYPRRGEIIHALEFIRQHEQAQMKFQQVLINGGAQ